MSTFKTSVKSHLSRVLLVGLACFAVTVVDIANAQASEDPHFLPRPYVSVDAAHQIIATDLSMAWMTGGGTAHLRAGLDLGYADEVAATDRIKVYDDTTFIGQCYATAPGACGWPVSSAQAATRHYRAYIAKAGVGGPPPTTYAAVSPPITVDWSAPIVLNQSGEWVTSNTAVTLTAVRSSGTYAAISFWDVPPRGTPVKLSAPNCTPGALICEIQVANPQSVHKYRATISGPTTPTAQSALLTVNWNNPPG